MIRLFVVLIAVAGFISCAKSEYQEPIIASWQDIELKESEFKTAYVDYVLSERRIDSEELRKNYAKYVLERKIIASYAAQSGLDTLFEVESSRIIAQETAQRQVYMKHYMDTRISEPEEIDVRSAFKRVYSAVRLEQIFARSKSEIDSLYLSLNRGLDFAELAKKSILKHAPQASDTSYRLGWIRYGMLDYTAELIAFSLEKGQVSRPIRSTQGWHIFKAIDVLGTENVDIARYQQEREALFIDLYRRKLEESTQFYIDSLFLTKELIVHDETYLRVYESLTQPLQKVLQKEKRGFQFKTAAQLAQQFEKNTPVGSWGELVLSTYAFLLKSGSIPLDLLESTPYDALSFLLKNEMINQLASNSRYPQNDSLVQSETQKALEEALYYAALRERVKTLDRKQLEDDFYTTYGAQAYPDSVVSTYNAYLFKDSAATIPVIEYWQKERFFTNVIPLFKDDYEVEQRTTRSPLSEIDGKPEHHFPMELPAKNQVFAGPYREPYGRYALIAPVSRYFVPKPKAEIQAQLTQDTNASLSALTHKYCLPDEYSMDQIHFNDDVIQNVLPYRN